jgi:hypothetical protein
MNSGIPNYGLRLEFEINPARPLGRQLWVRRPDGTRIAADEWEYYLKHRRDLEAMSIPDRIAYLQRGSFDAITQACLTIDQHFRPGHLLALDLVCRRLLDQPARSPEHQRGRQILALLRQLRRRFRAGGEKGPASRFDPRERTSRIAEAEEFLRMHLAGGPLPVADVQEAARKQGISRPTLRRAMESLAIHTEPVMHRQGKGGIAYHTWSLRCSERS